MNKSKLNYFVDALALISFLITAVSGLVIFFFLSEGVRRGGYQKFWGVAKHTWSSIHDYVGIIFIILVAIHFLLHWKWFISMTRCVFSREKKESCALENKEKTG